MTDTKHPEAAGLPPEYMLAKLAMVMPLFQEARDALTALTVAQRNWHRVSPTLADRMDIAGTFSLDDWQENFPERAALSAEPAPPNPPGWRAAIQSVRDGLAAGSRSMSNSDLEIDFGGALLDAVAERLEAAEPAPPPQEPKPQAAAAAIPPAKRLSLELEGVIFDVEQGRGFDDVCLRTIKRVCASLSAERSAPTAPAEPAEARRLSAEPGEKP